MDERREAGQAKPLDDSNTLIPGAMTTGAPGGTTEVPEELACPQCGELTEPNASFCEACGVSLREDFQAQDDVEEEPPRSKLWWVIVLVWAAVAIFALSQLYVWLWSLE